MPPTNREVMSRAKVDSELGKTNTRHILRFSNESGRLYFVLIHAPFGQKVENNGKKVQRQDRRHLRHFGFPSSRTQLT